MQMNWPVKAFAELTPHELYAILRLRAEVFVVEQRCAFQDCDNNDQFSLHLTGWHNNALAAYTRLVPPGICYAEPSIGRVVTAPAYRKQKLGRELMERSIAACTENFGVQPIRIGAQLYLKNFYESFGFRQQGEMYMEDGIAHIYMLREA